MEESLWEKDLKSTFLEYQEKIVLTKEDEEYLNNLWSELLTHIKKFGNLLGKKTVIIYNKN